MAPDPPNDGCCYPQALTNNRLLNNQRNQPNGYEVSVVLLLLVISILETRVWKWSTSASCQRLLEVSVSLLPPPPATAATITTTTTAAAAAAATTTNNRANSEEIIWKNPSAGPSNGSTVARNFNGFVSVRLIFSSVASEQRLGLYHYCHYHRRFKHGNLLQSPVSFHQLRREFSLWRSCRNDGFERLD